MKTNLFFSLAAILAAVPAYADDIDMNMAQMQAMDKITGRVSLIEVPVGGEVKFGTFSIVVRSCKTRSEEEIPENSAFVDVTDKSFDKEEFNIFKGWMFSSSPAVNAVEHPIYDVWLLKCFNGEPNPEQLLTEEQLAARDTLPTLREIRVQQQKNRSETETIVPENIQFKDTMYKVENPEYARSASDAETNSGPENLLNIKENYKTPEETTVTVPAEELSEALSTEAENLNRQMMKPEKTFDDTVSKEDLPPLPIDEDLAAAIEAELAGQQNAPQP